jgi:hypothetical protein
MRSEMEGAVAILQARLGLLSAKASKAFHAGQMTASVYERVTHIFAGVEALLPKLENMLDVFREHGATKVMLTE